ncbi:cytochrome d ubiquinol oxidase subunit II [Conexibacter sp. JD483]|uniref:cytochrome d ubiquinol oxidase subunit II n=1 Tax=unclassified Conexibacter TaxID=2627773 RepID=UPI0027286933|nr:MULTISPECIES: cytochrome d ubiquinol oxidase subunit II [unclassified Conexibacter]MDO8188716.1 cytochrome d ubiquinol oxidase subunit II [Conexibacter sp. CPCC 205706]MDO8201243.1 cytochrome d ubiquinol oxidase subunit II [Conexibacter sp. CPCC 205762]MDR9370931.1 cytochrome d ubiquinol oxidase subunit II [Conexibacter sp. JD483]
MPDLTVLQTIWFVAIVLLWGLYFVLEGFDFGVGMLMRRVRRDHDDRRVALHAIGPTWAANEVWAVIAVVAMFGAFPGWYGAWASALYVPLTLILLSLILRNLAIELIGKRDDPRWRLAWERVLVAASTLAPFLWGMAWSAVVWGIAMKAPGSADAASAAGASGGAAASAAGASAGAAADAARAAAGSLDVTAGPLDVISLYSVAGGLAYVLLSRAAGAAFLTLRTAEDVHAAAARQLRLAAPLAAVAVGGFLAWTLAAAPGTPGVVGWLAAAGCFVALATLAIAGLRVAASAANPGAAVANPGAAVAFGAACAAVALLLVSWFALLFPAGIAGADGGPALALADVASGSYSLWLMTGVTVLLLPLVGGLQAWSYWLFRHRITRADVGAPPPSPVDLVARLAGGRTSADPAAAGPTADTPAVPHGPGFRRRRSS